MGGGGGLCGVIVEGKVVGHFISIHPLLPSGFDTEDLFWLVVMLKRISEESYSEPGPAWRPRKIE